MRESVKQVGQCLKRLQGFLNAPIHYTDQTSQSGTAGEEANQDDTGINNENQSPGIWAERL